MSDNVIDLNTIREMQKALDDADIPRDDPDLPTMIAYRDLHGMPQLVIEGYYLTAQQLENMPDDIKDMLQLQYDGE